MKLNEVKDLKEGDYITLGPNSERFKIINIFTKPHNFSDPTFILEDNKGQRRVKNLSSFTNLDKVRTQQEHADTWNKIVVQNPDNTVFVYSIVDRRKEPRIGSRNGIKGWYSDAPCFEITNKTFLSKKDWRSSISFPKGYFNIDIKIKARRKEEKKLEIVYQVGGSEESLPLLYGISTLEEFRSFVLKAIIKTHKIFLSPSMETSLVSHFIEHEESLFQDFLDLQEEEKFRPYSKEDNMFGALFGRNLYKKGSLDLFKIVGKFRYEYLVIRDEITKEVSPITFEVLFDKYTFSKDGDVCGVLK